MDGRRGQDGWGRYTRRRKWYRDAELVEVSTAEQSQLDDSTATLKPPIIEQPHPASPMSVPSSPSSTAKDSDTASVNSNQPRKRSFFSRSSKANTKESGDFSSGASGASTLRGTEEDDGPQLPPSSQHTNRDWEIGDDVKMGLG